MTASAPHTAAREAPFLVTLACALVGSGLGFLACTVLDIPVFVMSRPLTCHAPMFLFFAACAGVLATKGHRRSARGVAGVPLAVACLFAWFAFRGPSAAVDGITDPTQSGELYAALLYEALLSVAMTTSMAVGLFVATWRVTPAPVRREEVAT